MQLDVFLDVLFLFSVRVLEEECWTEDHTLIGSLESVSDQVHELTRLPDAILGVEFTLAESLSYVLLVELVEYLPE